MHVHQWRGEFDRAAESQQRARVLAVGDRQLAFVEQHVGKRLFDSGHYCEALDAFAAALTLRQRCGAPEDQLLSSRVAVQRAGELASRSID
ncbi:MAG: hypothetical protein J2O49_11430, partial [Sciscionella sp.]|nr:hypothetical protein [Sciscionella sp.]